MLERSPEQEKKPDDKAAGEDAESVGQLLMKADPPVHRPRQGWDEQFRKMAEQGDDLLLDADTLPASPWEKNEWGMVEMIITLTPDIEQARACFLAGARATRHVWDTPEEAEAWAHL